MFKADVFLKDIKVFGLEFGWLAKWHIAYCSRIFKSYLVIRWIFLYSFTLPFQDWIIIKPRQDSRFQFE